MQPKQDKQVAADPDDLHCADGISIRNDAGAREHIQTVWRPAIIDKMFASCHRGARNTASRAGSMRHPDGRAAG